MTNTDDRHSDRDYELVVNARPHVVDDDTVTFNQIVELAFPGATANPNLVHSITFRGAHKPQRGQLAEGGSVEIKKKGAIFSVTQTDKS